MRKRIVLYALLGLLLLCIASVAVSALSNLGLPTESEVVERLSDADKARLEEALHLRKALGDEAWPGFGRAEIPVLLWNEEYEFLVGHPDPPGGWEAVPNDAFRGEPYYRRPAMDPQAFAVLVGDRWVASMSTRDYTVISLVAQVREDLPPSLEPVFPYRLVVPLFNAEWHVTAVNHEAFHVYQAQVAFDRFVESEAVRSFAGYPFDDAAFTVAWEEERDLLRRAVRAETDEEAARLARAFLERRAGRRAAANLSSSAVAYERRREWVEGTAKYVEYVLWRDAVRTGYQPVPEVRDLPDFKGYQRSFAQYGPEQRRLIGEGANREGDGRFYYSGLGQALLLDRFAPGWQEELLEEGAWLETLLDEALAE